MKGRVSLPVEVEVYCTTGLISAACNPEVSANGELINTNKARRFKGVLLYEKFVRMVGFRPSDFNLRGLHVGTHTLVTSAQFA